MKFFSRLFDKRVAVTSTQADRPEISMLDACTTALEEVGDEAAPPRDEAWDG